MSDATENEDCLVENIENFAQPLRIYSGFHAIIVVLVVVTSLPFWLIKRKKLIYLSKRSFPAAFLNGITQLFALLAGPATIVSGSQNNPAIQCPLYNTAFLSVVPLLVTTGLVSAIGFRNRASLTRALADNAERNYEQSEQKKVPSYYWYMANERFLTTIMFILSGVLIAVTFGISSTLCTQLGAAECTILTTTNEFAIIISLLYALAGGFLVTYIQFQLRSFPDPFRILKEQRNGFILAVGYAIPVVILASFNPGQPTEKEGTEKVFFTYGVFVDLAFFIFFLYLVPFQIYKAYKFNTEKAVFHDITLGKILEDEVGQKLLKQHLIHEFSVENILFLLEIKRLRELEESMDSPEKVKQEILRIYNSFIKYRRLNIGADIMVDIDQGLKDGDCDVKIFTEAYEEVYDLIDQDAFLRFKETPEFMKYIGISSNDHLIDDEKDEVVSSRLETEI